MKLRRVVRSFSMAAACSAVASLSVAPGARAQTGKPKPAHKKVVRHTRKAAADSTVKKASGPKWPVDVPPLMPGSILPEKRILAFYGNPLSKGMGILGALPPERMLAKLDTEVAKWNAADPAHPVQPALQLITVVASNTPGTAGKYRTRMDSALIEKVYGWAQQKHALLFLDIQVGQGTLQEELPRLVKFLKRPDVELAIDPEFAMKHGDVPGKKVGTFDAADVNYASSLLQSLVDSEHIPPKILVVHRWTHDMLTNYKKIALDPRVQIVIDMDGWGSPARKIDTYKAWVYRYPVEYTGFKIFYHNDTKHGWKLMTPADVLALTPQPLYIQYQ